ncbi:MAG TPA: DUF2288 domain-containing protein [Geobacter sp.]|nr:DUF2288 domain-containing protein [Geobacter sp.]
MSVEKEELAAKIDTADWQALRAHLERGGVVIVDPLLDLAEVGVALAKDDVKSVERWLSSGLIAKPSAQQIQSWDAEKGKNFLCLIVSPYVLAQEESPTKG